jgi:hypothetical protein
VGRKTKNNRTNGAGIVGIARSVNGDGQTAPRAINIAVKIAPQKESARTEIGLIILAFSLLIETSVDLTDGIRGQPGFSKEKDDSLYFLI